MPYEYCFDLESDYGTAAVFDKVLEDLASSSIEVLLGETVEQSSRRHVSPCFTVSDEIRTRLNVYGVLSQTSNNRR